MWPGKCGGVLFCFSFWFFGNRKAEHGPTLAWTGSSVVVAFSARGK